MYKPQTATKNKNSTKKVTPVDDQIHKKIEPNPKPQVKNIKSSSSKQQNIKQFKMQIDQEIAKCLDTLDRQGIKYLKETLRYSNIFNNQQVKQKIKPQSEQNIKVQQKQTLVPYNQIQQEIPQDPQIGQEIQNQLINNQAEIIQEQVPQTIKPKLLQGNIQKIKKPINQPTKPFTKIPKITMQDEQKPIDKSQIDSLVERISNLPQKKLQQLGKIIDKLQMSQKLQDQDLIYSKSQKPYMFRIPDQANRPNTVKAKRKGQKATSLHDNIMLKKKKQSPQIQKNQDNQIDQEIQKEEIEQEFKVQQQKGSPLQNSQKMSEVSSYSTKQQKIKQNQDKKNIKMDQKKSSSTLDMKKNTFSKKFPINVTNPKKSIHIQPTQSINIQSLSQSKTQTKLVKLGKKKIGVNKVDILLVKNRGHPSIIGLTSIQIFSYNGKKIQITSQNIKKPTNSFKTMRLFNGMNLTTNEQNMFLQKIGQHPFEIELQIIEKIGGLKVWNYNKSEIENSKEVSQFQIWINNTLQWKGQIGKGSYNQMQNYDTKIYLDYQFKFPQQITPTPKLDLGFSKKIQQKASWLQTTLVQKKIKQLQVDQDNNQNKRKLSSRVQRKQVKQQINFNFKKQKNQFDNYLNSNVKDLKIQKKQLNLQDQQKQPKVQINAGRSTKNIRKIQVKRPTDQFDIFGSVTQNQFAAIKQRQKKIQIKKQQEFIESSTKLNQQKQRQRQLQVQRQIQKQAKKVHERSMDDFMNDSLFQDAPKKDKFKGSKAQFVSQKNSSKPIREQKKKQIDKNVNLDDFINQLNDVVGKPQQKYKFGDQQSKEIVIPQLPKGNKMIMSLLQNWGDSQYIGLNKIQFFDQNGQKIFPSQIKLLNQTNFCHSLTSIFSNIQFQKNKQWKQHRKGNNSISISFSKNVQIALIRIWNYWGDRVHTMIGVKKMQVLLDGCCIFIGQIRKSSGSSQDAYKYCQYILFTNNVIIQKRIRDNDWLNNLLKQNQKEKVIFQKTLQNFHRPQTKQGSKSQGIRNIKQQIKVPIKLPKRQCFQYDPPIFPGGYFLKLILHQTWGDRDFVGLNGIVIFDQKGDQVKNIMSISDYPTSLSSLSGYEKDKRVVKNLLNNKNLTDNEEDIWLAPYQTDMDKIDKKTNNMIVIAFEKPIKISGINLYNYIKHPYRGARQVEVFMDNTILYRGYIKMAGNSGAETHTTINFTKDVSILQKMNYMGYHEDNLQQNVVFINEGKIIRNK